MVPGRTRLVGGVMVGTVGLAMPSGALEGVALTTPGPGMAHPPSDRTRMALSTRRPSDAAVILPAPRPSRVLVMAKTCDPILRPLPPGGASASPALSILYAGQFGGASVTWVELCQ